VEQGKFVLSHNEKADHVHEHVHDNANANVNLGEHVLVDVNADSFRTLPILSLEFHHLCQHRHSPILACTGHHLISWSELIGPITSAGAIRSEIRIPATHAGFGTVFSLCTNAFIGSSRLRFCDG